MNYFNKILILIICLITFSVFINPQSKDNSFVIGSKKFTENVILGELAYQLGKTETDKIIYKKELGGTRILWNALLYGDIDLYPEYTGTIRQEILAGINTKGNSLEELLLKNNIKISKPLGFNNTYAIGMRNELAVKLNIKTISDLSKHPQLKYTFTNEFMDRKDGWPGLKAVYNLENKNVQGIDHDLAYRGLINGDVDVTDFYSTDAEIKYYDLAVLKDDKNYFPEYKAVFLYRADTEKYSKTILSKILLLEGKINENEMVKMNADVKINKKTEREIASNFLSTFLGINSNVTIESIWDRLFKNTKEHLFLVLISLIAAIFTAIPLGIFASQNDKAGKLILGIVGMIQTIPSLALLVFMIPLFGIGSWPAIVALFFYSLLPIVRGTYSGLKNIPLSLNISAEALGLPTLTKLKKIELPLASPSILSGIKTSAVINVGTATLGALIGAGGYGQPILTGIRLDNVSLILQGAIPAALLALLVQWFFDIFEKIIVPRGISLKK